MTIPQTQFRNKNEIMTYDQKVYYERSGNFGYRKLQAMNEARAKRCGKYEFSTNSKKRFTRAVNNIALVSPRKWKKNPYTDRMQLHEITFLTLTIACPRILGGREAMENLFTPFLEYLKRTAKTSKGKGIKHYVWKIEKQTLNTNQLHLHIIMPEMIHLGECQKKWNQLQRAGGYLKEYAARFGNYNPPNGLDVKPFTSERLASYLLKELAKKEQNPVGLDCKVWGCTDGLEEPYFTLDLTQAQNSKLERMVRDKRLSVKTRERFSMGFSKEADIPKEVLSKAEFEEFVMRIRIIGGQVERPVPEPPGQYEPVLNEAGKIKGWVPVQTDFKHLFSSS